MLWNANGAVVSTPLCSEGPGLKSQPTYHIPVVVTFLSSHPPTCSRVTLTFTFISHKLFTVLDGSVIQTNKQTIYEGHTESHEQLFFACKLGTADERECGGRWNQLLCYPWVSCDVDSLHHVTSITPNKMADNNMLFRQCAVIEFLVKEEIPAAEIHQRLQRAYGVFKGGWNILKMGKRRQFKKQCVSFFGWLERSSTAGEFSNFQNNGRNVYKEVAIMWKNKESYVD